MLLESLLLCVFTLGALAQEVTSTSSSSATAETTAASTSSSSAAAETTVNLFLRPSANIGDTFVSLVVNVDPCTTIYGLVYTSGLEENLYCQPLLTVRSRPSSSISFCYANLLSRFTLRTDRAPTGLQLLVVVLSAELRALHEVANFTEQLVPSAT